MRKTPNTPDRSLLITEFAEFYRCNGDNGLRYYPATPSHKGVAIDYNSGNLPATVQGFAVYDTTVTMDYAVALYGSKEEAMQHDAAPVPDVPATIFAEEKSEAEAADDAAWSDGAPAAEPELPRKPFRFEDR